jgi:hypothetical protein
MLLKSDTIPESLVDALVTPERYDAALSQVTLDPEVDALWTDQWIAFTAG